MKNLQNFGVQELSAKEMKEIDGGSLFSRFIVATLFILAAILISRNNPSNVNVG